MKAAWVLAEAALLLGLGIACGLVSVCNDLSVFDEALILVGSERVLHGEVPFRDFYALYPPGQYYVVAGLMQSFGRSALTLRLYCIVVRALIALVLYYLARKLVPRWLALPCWGACILWLSVCGFYGYPTFPALLLALCGLSLLGSCVDRTQAEGRPPRLLPLAAGGLLGAAALFRHDVAAYGLVASLPLAVAVARRQASVWGAYLAGMVVTFGIPMAFLLAVVPVREVIFELFTYPFSTYPKVRGIPYPPIFPRGFSSKFLTEPVLLAKMSGNLSAYTPPLFSLLGLVLWGARVRAGGRAALHDSRNLRLLSIALLGGLAFNLARVRSDVIHGIAMLVLSYPLAVVLVRSALEASRRAVRIVAAGGLAAVALASLWMPILGFQQTLVTDDATNCRSGGRAREEAAAFVRSLVPPGGRIFVGCGRHDIVFANEPILYFLAERLPGTRYHALDPGVATTLDVQRRIVDDLIRNRVDYLVLSSMFDGRSEPNLSAVSSNVTHLDRYLRSNYERVRMFGTYVSVWRRTP
jgi:hypothetical protein